MLDAENTPDNQAVETPAELTAPAESAPEESTAPAKKAAAKKTAAKKTAAKRTTTKKVATKRVTKKSAAEPGAPSVDETMAPAGDQLPESPGDQLPASPAAPAGSAEVGTDASDPATAAKKAPAKKAAKKTTGKRTTKKAAAEQAAPVGTPDEPGETPPALISPADTPSTETSSTETETESAEAQAAAATMLLFKAPEPTKSPPRSRKKAAEPETGSGAAKADSAAPKGGKQGDGRGPASEDKKTAKQDAETAPSQEDRQRESDEESEDEQGGNRRRRRRGGRRRRKSGGEDGSDATESESEESSTATEPDAAEDAEGTTGTRRRRRRRRAGEEGGGATDDPENTVVRVRKPRSAEDEITALSGSTRLEAKKQRRREGREAGRRRAPIVSEAEFLARREAVDRVMVIRQKKDLTQIAVLEDKVLVEHYVARESQTSLIGNVYLGRVQNVLPSMEAAFIDIGKGRNAVLYAGEVNWDSLGAKDGQPRRIESVLKSGQSVLVQVTKDPVGHKGARLTSQISLPGRFLVYVPDGTTSGISRKLPDTERNRLKTLLKEIVPDTAGVIVRTAAEGASEDELTRDVERLTARWDDIQGKVKGGNAPQLLYGEPDLTLKVVRDLFTEDFGRLVVAGQDAWEMVDGYVTHVAPDLSERLEKWDGGEDVFAAYRIEEQIAKALDRKVWLPSGGSLIIDRTEAMTVVDVNTGKFTGSGGNLEETVTKNNLEAAEEIVRQLRLRDIGGIIVVDFIDMVLESNRDLVLRRMVECLGRDRTRHQVAEVTSLGLVQMTRKRIGTGLLEAFSESCEHCQGRGLLVHHEPVEPKKKSDEEPRRARRGGRGGRGGGESAENGSGQAPAPSPKDLAEMAKAEKPAEKAVDKDTDKAVDKGADAKKAPDKAPDHGEERGSGRGAGKAGRKDAEKPVEHAGKAAETPADATEEVSAEPKEGAKPKRKRGGAKSAKSHTEPTEKPASPTENLGEESAAQPAGEAGPDAPAVTEAPVSPEAPAVTEAPDRAVEEPGQAAEQAPPAAPKVVTSVRRRGAARRPAGPPPGASAAAASGDGAADSLALGGGVPADGTSALPVGGSTSESGAAAAPSEDGVPTTPGAGSTVQADSEAAKGDGVDADLPLDVDESAAAHVPVKRKGARKR